MSITVNYKGEQIAQSAGDNLTLNTAGKYMEADVILQALGGGGSAVAEGEITLDTASDTITVTHNLGTQNVAILVEHENPTYGVNGAVGCLFVNKTGIPFSASGFFAGGAIHVVYETRTTWASYSAAQVNSTSLQAYFSMTDNAVTIPCRNGNYKYQTGTYKYKVFILSASGGGLSWEHLGSFVSDTLTSSRGTLHIPFRANKMYKIIVQNVSSAPSNAIRYAYLFTTDTTPTYCTYTKTSGVVSGGASTLSDGTVSFNGSGTTWQFPTTQTYDVYITDITNIRG